MRSLFNGEMVNPFRPVKGGFVIRAEHFMRYEFAKNYLKKTSVCNKSYF